MRLKPIEAPSSMARAATAAPLPSTSAEGWAGHPPEHQAEPGRVDVVVLCESTADHAAAAAFVQSLHAQSWSGWEAMVITAGGTALAAGPVSGPERVRPALALEPGGDVLESVRAARTSGRHLLVATPRTRLTPTALEKMVWYLETHGDRGFVTGLLDGPPGAAPFCDALAAATLFSAGALDALPAAPALRRDVPPALALAAAIAGRAGGWQIRERLLSVAATAPAAAPLPWAAFGLADAVLGATGRDPLVESRPLQAIAENPPLRTSYAPPVSGRRVLFLLQGFVMGGYTTFNTDLIPRLRRAGHAVSVCTTEFWRTDRGLDQVLAATPDVFHLPGFLPPNQFLRFIAGIVASREIEVVVVSHSFFGYHCLPWLRRHFPRVAFVDYVHTDWSEEQMYGSYATLSSAFAGELDVRMASSAALKGLLCERGAPAEAVEVCHINIDSDAWRRAVYHNPGNLQSLRDGRTGPIILFSARAAPEKRPLLAVQLLARLAADGVPFTFVVAGVGPLLVSMVETAQAAGIADRCVFLGELGEEQIRFVYAVSDIYFVPSAIEGIARTLYEAMAMECVPVVADVGGQRELVAPECGYLVEPGAGEQEAYLAALRTLATDPRARARMSAAARERIVREFSATACVETFGQVFETARSRCAARADAAAPSALALRTALLGLEVSRRNYLRHVPTG